jgi:histidinol-phosphate aminotransferase
MSRFWSPIVQTLSPYTPGEQPIGQRFIKLNTNENPYGPSPRALEAMRAASDDGLRLYPDPTARQLRQSLGASLGLDADHIFVGNGSDEVLAHSFNAFFRDKAPVQFADVTYSFYKTYCALYQIAFREIPLDATFRADPAAYQGPNGGVILANPNAPTGVAMPLSDVAQILAQNRDVVVIVDEAYVGFGSQSAVSLVPSHDNLLVVQTFSKSRSLAGLRVGFAIGQPPLIEGLMRVKDSFNSYPLGRLALLGAKAAWEDHTWFETTRRQVMQSRADMRAELLALGFSVPDSAANFLFAAHRDHKAVDLLASLRAKGLLVRHFRQARTENWLRISVGTGPECAALIAALREILA